MKLTVEGHLFKIYDEIQGFMKKPFWLNEGRPVNNDKAMKVLGLIEKVGSPRGFAYGVISMKEVIKKNFPMDEEIAAFLSQYVKPEFHQELVDILIYFDNLLINI